MVLLGRIELPTSALPRMRSTTELQQHTISAAPEVQRAPGRAALLAGGSGIVNPMLAWRARSGACPIGRGAAGRRYGGKW